MLFLVRCFFYTPHASFSDLFLFSRGTPDNTSSQFLLHTVITIVLVRSFSYIPHIDHSVDVLKHFACWIGENLLLHSLTRTPHAGVS